MIKFSTHGCFTFKNVNRHTPDIIELKIRCIKFEPDKRKFSKEYCDDIFFYTTSNSKTGPLFPINRSTYFIRTYLFMFYTRLCLLTYPFMDFSWNILYGTSEMYLRTTGKSHSNYNSK